jgi:hypothetical protein
LGDASNTPFDTGLAGFASASRRASSVIGTGLA